ncbi:hypothetical protein J6590_027455 [Homalodisca vitripennis]|nr:hypothetical protein J6590_027455 [Homalodisca vitripennis]
MVLQRSGGARGFYELSEAKLEDGNLEVREVPLIVGENIAIIQERIAEVLGIDYNQEACILWFKDGLATSQVIQCEDKKLLLKCISKLIQSDP